MNQDIFVDGIGNINVTGNIVRIDLVALQPQMKSENGQPVFATSQRIVMPLDGFLQSMNLQQNIIQQLVQAGVLKVNAVQNAPAAPIAANAAAEAAATAEAADQKAEDKPEEEEKQ